MIMKKLVSIFACSLIVGGTTFYFCERQEYEIVEGEDVTQVVSSPDSCTFVRAGFEIFVSNGTIPPNSRGEDGHVAFSVTRYALLDTVPTPAALPEGTQLANNAYVLVEPMNFTFSTPIQMNVPAQGYDISAIALLHFNQYSEDWDIVPFTSHNDDGTATVLLLELGYFALVEFTEPQYFGGIRIRRDSLEQGYDYFLTLASNNRNDESSTRISTSHNDYDIFMSSIPFGSYRTYLSRELSDDSLNVGRPEYFDLGTINVTDTLVAAQGNYENWTGWTEIVPTINRWRTGRNRAWGDETITYGTGAFQATLTFVNQARGMTTDYDLHLYGPNNLHVYYNHKRQGAFELDRDWMHALGNAVENLYSVEDSLPPGDYRVEIHHYSGRVSKQFNCRVLMDGKVVKSVRSSINSASGSEEIYTFTVE